MKKDKGVVLNKNEMGQINEIMGNELNPPVKAVPIKSKPNIPPKIEDRKYGR